MAPATGGWWGVVRVNIGIAPFTGGCWGEGRVKVGSAPFPGGCGGMVCVFVVRARDVGRGGRGYRGGGRGTRREEGGEK